MGDVIARVYTLQAAERALVAHARMLPTADQFADSFVGWQFAPASDAGVGIVVAVTELTTAGLDPSVAMLPPEGSTSSAATPPPKLASVPTEFAPGVPVGPEKNVA